MNNEEHDDLWDLLGKARQPTVSPFFSRNVLREIRAHQQDRPGFFVWLRRHWQATAVATCAVIVAVGAFTQHRHKEEHQILAMAERVSNSPDYQVIAHLDELLDSEENSIWLDGNTY